MYPPAQMLVARDGNGLNMIVEYSSEEADRGYKLSYMLVDNGVPFVVRDGR